jgi:hypothetical protein
MMRLPLDLELHVTFQNRDQLVRGVREVLPTLARWIGSEITGEAAGGPVGAHLLAVGQPRPALPAFSQQGSCQK